MSPPSLEFRPGSIVKSKAEGHDFITVLDGFMSEEDIDTIRLLRITLFWIPIPKTDFLCLRRC